MNTSFWKMTFEPITPIIFRNSIFEEGWFDMCKFTTFMLNYCKVMESPHFRMPNIKATIVGSSNHLWTHLVAVVYVILSSHSNDLKKMLEICWAMLTYFPQRTTLSFHHIHCFFQRLNCSWATLLSTLVLMGVNTFPIWVNLDPKPNTYYFP